jgi:hypothetical protein
MMNDYIQRWMEELVCRPRKSISVPIELTGERAKHFGPRSDYASVRIVLESSTEFEVVNEVGDDQQLKSLGYPEHFIFGLLDILMTAEAMPRTSVRVVLKSASYDPVDSSPKAFLEAGRDAGQKVHALLSKS